MKVALVTDGLYPDVIGGMQKHSFFLAKHLARNNVEVDLYFTADKADQKAAFDFFTPDEKEHIHEKFIPFPDHGFLPGHYLKESLAYSTAVYEEIEKRPAVDVIYAQGFTGWYCCIQRSKGKLQIPVFVNIHGVEMFQPAFGFKARLQQLMLKEPAKYIMQHADYVYSLGGKLTEIINAVADDRSRVIVQPIGIGEGWVKADIPEPKKPTERCRFVFVGRYEKRKGLDILNQVMKSSDAEKTEFHLVGPIEKKHQVVASNVNYHGLVTSDQEMMEHLDKCHILICPSFAEGMPTVILEAMSRGLAVIATDVGAVSELVSKATGWLIEAGNVQQLKEAVDDACSSDQLETKRRNARDLIAQRFTWPDIITKTLDDIRHRLNLNP